MKKLIAILGIVSMPIVAGACSSPTEYDPNEHDETALESTVQKSDVLIRS